jgi:hypothetical protein
MRIKSDVSLSRAPEDPRVRIRAVRGMLLIEYRSRGDRHGAARATSGPA